MTQKVINTGKVSGTGDEVEVTVIADTAIPAQKRLQVETRLAPGSTVITTQAASSPADLFNVEATNGGSPDMNVDGSGTPVVFTIPADATRDVQIRELRLVFSGPKSLKMDGDTFGEKGGALTNGVLIEATVNGGTTTALATIKRNEGFFRLASTTGLNALFSDNGVSGLIVASYVFGGSSLLEAGSGDNLKITIRDNITPGGATRLKHFRAVGFGSLL